MVCALRHTVDISIYIGRLSVGNQGLILHILDQTDLIFRPPVGPGKARYYLEITPCSTLWCHQLVRLLEPFDVDFSYYILKGRYEAAH